MTFAIYYNTTSKSSFAEANPALLDTWLLFAHAGEYTDADGGKDIKMRTSWEIFKTGEVLGPGENLFDQHGDNKLEQEAKAEWQNIGIDSMVAAKPRVYTEWLDSYNGSVRKRGGAGQEQQVSGIVGRGAEALQVLTAGEKADEDAGMHCDLTEKQAPTPSPAKLKRGKSSAALSEGGCTGGAGEGNSEDEREDNSDVGEAEDGDFLCCNS